MKCKEINYEAMNEVCERCDMQRLTYRDKDGRIRIKLFNGTVGGTLCTPAIIDRATRIAIDHLAELEDELENGTLVKLPCKVGTTIYWVDNYFPELAKIEEIKLIGFGYNWVHKTVFMLDNDKSEIYEYNFGKEAFLSREEAEKRLEELRGCRK